MNFSLIFPTRERPELLNNLFRSLNNTTSNKKSVEILIAKDKCDKTNVRKIIKKYPELNIKLFEVERSTNFSKDYYNFLAGKSKGKFIWAINDDVEFVTKFWDVILNAEIELFFRDKLDRIVYCSTGDGINHWKFCCFPIISRETFEETRYIFNERYTTRHADQDLSSLFKYPVLCERRLSLTDKVELIHNSYHTGMRPQDKLTSYIRFNMRTTDDIDYTERSIRNITARINKYKENNMVFKRTEAKVEPVKEVKPIVVEVDATEKVVDDYKGNDDGIVTNPKIG